MSIVRITENEKAYRNKKVRCDFSIVSQTVLPEHITQELEIEPDRSHKKGNYKIEGRDTIYTRPSHLWEISSVKAIQDQDSVLTHIHYLRKKLESKLSILGRYKQDPRYESIVYIRNETEKGSTGVTLGEDDLALIRRICNRFSCSLWSKSK